MWTSSILLIISLFTARLAEFEQGILNLVDQVRSAQESPVDIAVTIEPEAPTLNVAVAPVIVAPTEVAPVVTAPEVIVSDLLEPDFEAPVTATNFSALQATMVMPHTMIKPAPPTKAQALVGKVQHFYNTTNSFTASFSQTVRNTTFSKLKPKVSTGKVYILKPGKMRWDYKNDRASHKRGGPKVSKSFISDGKHLWAVMHKNKQFYKQSLNGSALPVAVSFLMGTGNLLNDFNVTMEPSGKFGSKSDLLLLLTPKVPSARYKKLWLVVDPANFSVKQSVVLNTKGDTNSIVFSSVVLDSGKLRKGHFIFNQAANKNYSLITPPQP